MACGVGGHTCCHLPPVSAGTPGFQRTGTKMRWRGKKEGHGGDVSTDYILQVHVSVGGPWVLLKQLIDKPKQTSTQMAGQESYNLSQRCVDGEV